MGILECYQVYKKLRESGEDIQGNEQISFLLDDVKSMYDEVHKIEDGYLALDFEHGEDRGSGHIGFALFQFYMSNVDGTEMRITPIFQGYGYGGALRECRHTWWYPDNGCADGYGFYPQGKLITAAFKFLSRYFDDLV